MGLMNNNLKFTMDGYKKHHKKNFDRYIRAGRIRKLFLNFDYESYISTLNSFVEAHKYFDTL